VPSTIGAVSVAVRGAAMPTTIPASADDAPPQQATKAAARATLHGANSIAAIKGVA
jgi:hypothetical protein